MSVTSPFVIAHLQVTPRRQPLALPLRLFRVDLALQVLGFLHRFLLELILLRDDFVVDPFGPFFPQKKTAHRPYCPSNGRGTFEEYIFGGRFEVFSHESLGADVLGNDVVGGIEGVGEQLRSEEGTLGDVCGRGKR